LIAPTPTETYTLSLHDALPISGGASSGAARVRTRAPAGAPCTGTRPAAGAGGVIGLSGPAPRPLRGRLRGGGATVTPRLCPECRDRKSTRLNSSHLGISYAVFC